MKIRTVVAPNTGLRKDKTAYPMVAAGKLGLTLPNKPRSKYQKYYTVPI